MKLQAIDYLKRAVELSRKSLNAGEFPAGAVLATKSGKLYESDPSVAWYHGECMVIDKAIDAESAPLTGAIMYSSMEPCLMCSSKMYWSGVTKSYFVIPKNKTNTNYAYEDDMSMEDHIKSFHTLIEKVNDSSVINDAISLYNKWVEKIEDK